MKQLPHIAKISTKRIQGRYTTHYATLPEWWLDKHPDATHVAMAESLSGELVLTPLTAERKAQMQREIQLDKRARRYQEIAR